jgi:putative heme-binding domain-containing protein
MPLPAEEPATDSTLAPLIELLGSIEDADFQLDLLKGMRAGLKGRKSVSLPAGWTEVYGKLANSKNEEVRENARLLSVVFGDPQALAELRKTMLDEQAPREQREAALAALVEKRLAELPPLLHKLIADRELCGSALRGLASFDDNRTPQIILGYYAKLGQVEKQDAITALAGRVAYAKALLAALEAGIVPVKDVTAYSARQLNNLGDAEVSAQLKKVWGDLRPSSEDKKKVIARFKAELTPEVLMKADPQAGRLVFQKSCQQCHKLYGTGATIGPELTGSNRANLDYILENAIDPSAVIGRDYRLTNILLEDGRVLSGILVEETERSLTVQTINQRLVLDKAEIDEMQPSSVSMMPEGQLEKMQPLEVRNLLSYLATKGQVPFPPGTPELEASLPLKVETVGGER